jgi:hypothetical protein
MRGCLIEHEYFEIGGKEWAAFKPGQINAEGKTENEFIAELKQEWAIGHGLWGENRLLD